MRLFFWKKYPYHRRLKFIDRKQQMRFAMDIVLHSMLFPVFFMLLTLVLVRDPFNSKLLRDFYAFCINQWWLVLGALFFVAYFSILTSHRIFGPIRRFENALHSKEAEPEKAIRCNIRRPDYLQDFAVHLERVLNGLTVGKSQADPQSEEKKEA